MTIIRLGLAILALAWVGCGAADPGDTPAEQAQAVSEPDTRYHVACVGSVGEWYQVSQPTMADCDSACSAHRGCVWTGGPLRPQP